MADKLVFENNELDIQELPKVEELEFNRIEQKYILVLMLQLFIPAIIINAAGLVLYFSANIDIPQHVIRYVLIVLNTLFLFRFVIILLSFKKRAFALRERDITYQRGLLVFRQTTVSVNRMQHIELNQSFLMKLLHLTTLKIYTAGGSQSDLSIAGIKKEKGEEIKELLTRKLSRHE